MDTMAISLYVQVAQSLEKEIKESDVPVGTLLPSERALAAKYHVSRSVIRQALAYLAEQELIELTPGQGACIRYVCDEKVIAAIRQMLLLHHSSFLDALEVREVLETAIVQKCIPYITEENLSTLYKIWDTMEAYQAERQIEHFLQQDALFHETIAKIIPNPMFHLLLQTVFSISPQNFFDLSKTMETAMQDTQREHLQILEGLKSRNSQQACQALKLQMDNIRSDLTLLSQRGPAATETMKSL